VEMLPAKAGSILFRKFGTKPNFLIKNKNLALLILMVATQYIKGNDFFSNILSLD